jgi:hypothetical protein
MSTLFEFRVSAELIIASERLTPEEMSAHIGVPYDRCWRIGDPRGKTGKTWATSGWVLKSSVAADAHRTSSLLSTCLNIFVERLRPIAHRIRTLSGEGDIGVSVDIVASDVPGLSIDREALKVIADTGAWLDIDVTISEMRTELVN